MLFFVHLWSQSVNTFHMRIGTQGTTHICPKKYKGFPKNTYHLEFRPSWKPEHCASIMMYSERITILWENALKQTPNIFLTSSSFPSPTKNKYTKQTLKEKVVSKTIIEGGFNTPLTSVNKSSRQSIKKHWP